MLINANSFLRKQLSDLLGLV